MNALANNDETTPLVALESLVAKHGVWTVLVALAAVLAPRRREVVLLDDLTPYMRRDMGLPPTDGPRKYWELR